VSEQVFCYGVYAALGKNRVAAVNTNTQNVKQPNKSTYAMFRYNINPCHVANRKLAEELVDEWVIAYAFYGFA
jgi:hypothetical protein